MKSITLKEKSVYGRQTMYPACGMAQLMCDMAQSKQFTPGMIRTAKEHGYTILVDGVSPRAI